MNESAQAAPSRAIVGILSALVIVVVIVAGYLGYKLNQGQQAIASLTSQLEDSQRQIAELQPLANRARTMPIGYRIDQHAITNGYDLFVSNRSRASLRFRFTVQAMGRSRQWGTVIDGGRGTVLHGLASGDTVVIESDGYDSRTIQIQ